MTEGTAGAAAEADAEYRAGPTRFRILDDALVTDSSKGDAEQSIALADVARVRIYVYQGRGFCLVTGKTGSDKPIVITTPQRGKPDEADQYVDFIEALHERIAAAAPDAEFIGGHAAFFALLIVCVVGMIAIFGTFVAALVSGADPAKAAPLLGTITLPLIVLASTSAGRPRKYDPNDIPDKYLPASG
jgi:hypothetical protein